MTIAVDWDVKHEFKSNKSSIKCMELDKTCHTLSSESCDTTKIVLNLMLSWLLMNLYVLGGLRPK